MSETNVIIWQRALHLAGFPPGAVDGVFGQATLKASLAAIREKFPVVPFPDGQPENCLELGYDWLPPSTKMHRVIAHWTGGSHAVSSTDKEHYHFIWDGNGDPVRGDKPVTANETTTDNDGYAAHTKNCNSGSIGVSMACMANAKESPLETGPYPMTKAQWEGMCRGIAQLCWFYGIPVTEETVLSHGEVEGTLFIDQDGKWDFTVLPWAPEVQGAAACGKQLRDDVAGFM